MSCKLFFSQGIGVHGSFSKSFGLNDDDGAPGETQTPDPLLRRYAVQNSKCRFWCRLRGSASFISPLNWTEDGLKFVARTRERLWTLRSAEFVRRSHLRRAHLNCSRRLQVLWVRATPRFSRRDDPESATPSL